MYINCYNVILGHANNILRVNKRKFITICAVSILKDVILFIEDESRNLYSEKKRKTNYLAEKGLFPTSLFLKMLRRQV